MVYWSEEEATVTFDCVRGRCAVRFFDLSTDETEVERWGEEGPGWFYFQQVSAPCLVHN